METSLGLSKISSIRSIRSKLNQNIRFGTLIYGSKYVVHIIDTLAG